VPRPPQNRASDFHRTRLKQAGQVWSVRRDPSRVATALGPFTAEAASNLSSGSHASPTSSSGSPDPVSTLSGRASALSGQLSETAPVEADACLVYGFLSPFGVPAFASGSSCPAEELGLPYGRLTGHTEVWPGLVGVSTFRTSELRPGWVPPLPRGPRCSPSRSSVLQPACAASQRPVPGPRCSVPSAGLHVTRHHRGFTCVHPSGLPPHLWPLDGTATLGLDHLSFAPRRYQRRTSG
jgi:hypothetical protein